MRYASVRAPVLGWLSCLLLVACTGRSSLDDFANDPPDIVRGRPGGGGTAGDSDAGNAGDGGSDDGGANDGGGNGNGNDGENNGDDNNGGSNDGNNNGGNGGAIGDACMDAEDCTGRSATCLEELNVFNFIRVPFPGGYCTQADCEQDSDCPAGSRCFDSIPGQTFCAKTCDANSDCRTRETYSCTTAPLSQESQTYCLPPISIPGGGGLPGGGGGSSGGSTRGGSTRGTTGGSTGSSTRGSNRGG